MRSSELIRLWVEGGQEEHAFLAGEPVPWDELDTNVGSLVKALNRFDPIVTTESCGGHKNPTPYQHSEGNWVVYFSVARTQDGWIALDFIKALAVLQDWSLQMYVNGSETVFYLEGDGGPEKAARVITRAQDKVYFPTLQPQ